LRNSS